MKKSTNLVDASYNIAAEFINNYKFIEKLGGAIYRVVNKTLRIDFPIILVATNYNITATMDAIIFKSPISYGIRELSDNPIVHFMAGGAKYSILEGESLAVISKVYNYLFTTNTSNDFLFNSFEYVSIKDSFLNRTSLAMIGGLNHLAYNKNVLPYLSPMLKIPGLEYSEVVGIETIDIASQGSVKLMESYSNKKDSVIDYYEVASDSSFLVSGLKIGAMAYVSIKEIYLNELLTTADLYKAMVAFSALNGINMIPRTIVNDAIGYIKSYLAPAEFSNTHVTPALVDNSEVCKLGSDCSVPNDEL